MNTHVNREPLGIPAGGQFAATARTESASVSLVPPVRRVTVGIASTVELTSKGVTPLPNWPADLPAPTVSFNPPGRLSPGLQVTVRWGGQIGQDMEFWTDDNGDPTSSRYDPDRERDYDGTLTDAQLTAIETYGHTAAFNVENVLDHLTGAANTERVNATVLALATSTETPPPPPATALTTDRRISAWTSTEVPDRNDVLQVLADLRAHSRAWGLGDDDFDRMIKETAL
jgi:hypothetical protein